MTISLPGLPERLLTGGTLLVAALSRNIKRAARGYRYSLAAVSFTRYPAL
ncbi:MAG: hypothetical protein LBD64_05775 [Odoribacteraceae bacterium]|nr:hypothetical protein [Odoribacteraceae bacterium]